MIKKISLFLVLVIISMCFYHITDVHALAYVTESKHIEIIYPHYGYSEGTVYIDNAPKGTEIRNLKIHNTKICSFDKEQGDNGLEISPEFKKVYISLIFKKPGKTSITGVIYRYGKFIKTFKTKIVNYKYKNPFKKVKIYGKNYARKFKKFDGIELKPRRGKKTKVSVKLKKGWRFESLLLNNYDNGLKDKYLRNNSTIKFTKRGDQSVYIYLTNKKYKNLEVYQIFFY